MAMATRKRPNLQLCLLFILASFVMAARSSGSPCHMKSGSCSVQSRVVLAAQGDCELGPGGDPYWNSQWGSGSVHTVKWGFLTSCSVLHTLILHEPGRQLSLKILVNEASSSPRIRRLPGSNPDQSCVVFCKVHDSAGSVHAVLEGNCKPYALLITQRFGTQRVILFNDPAST